MTDDKKTAPLAGGAAGLGRFRTLGGVTFDLDDREQMLAYRRMKYRMRKYEGIRTEIIMRLRGYKQVIIRYGGDAAGGPADKCAQRTAQILLEQGVPVTEIVYPEKR